MRTWLSFPLGSGIRTGVSVNPRGLITRELQWHERMSPTGLKVWYGVAAVIGLSFLAWIIAAKDHEPWLLMVISFAVVQWLAKRAVMDLFPRQMEIEVDPVDTPRNAGRGEMPGSTAYD